MYVVEEFGACVAERRGDRVRRRGFAGLDVEAAFEKRGQGGQCVDVTQPLRQAERQRFCGEGLNGVVVACAIDAFQRRETQAKARVHGDPSIAPARELEHLAVLPLEQHGVDVVHERGRGDVADRQSLARIESARELDRLERALDGAPRVGCGLLCRCQPRQQARAERRRGVAQALQCLAQDRDKQRIRAAEPVLRSSSERDASEQHCVCWVGRAGLGREKSADKRRCLLAEVCGQRVLRGELQRFGPRAQQAGATSRVVAARK